MLQIFIIHPYLKKSRVYIKCNIYINFGNPFLKQMSVYVIKIGSIKNEVFLC